MEFSQNEINESASIGDYIQGGTVFWVDPNGNTKGLVCSDELGPLQAGCLVCI